MPIFKATVQVTVLLQADSQQEAERELDLYDLEDLYHEMDDGAYVGTFAVTAVQPVPPHQLNRELLLAGNDGSFFDPLDGSDPEEPGDAPS